MDRVVGGHVRDLVGKPRYRHSTHGEFGESLRGCAGMRPSECVPDGAVDGSEELPSETVALLVVPDGSGFEFRCRVGVEGDRPDQPLLSRSAIRSRVASQS